MKSSLILSSLISRSIVNVGDFIEGLSVTLVGKGSVFDIVEI